jgi:hypothetical protein
MFGGCLQDLMFAAVHRSQLSISPSCGMRVGAAIADIGSRSDASLANEGRRRPGGSR